MTAKSTDKAKPAVTAARTTRTKSPTSRSEVLSVQAAAYGKVAVVSLGSWLPASGMKALREQLLAATGKEPIILSPGSRLDLITEKEAATVKVVPVDA